jgi:hypothetical protein
VLTALPAAACAASFLQARLVKFVAVLDAALTPARVEAALASLEMLLTDDRLTRYVKHLCVPKSLCLACRFM